MAADGTLGRQLVLVGANHRSAPVALRDRLFIDDGAQPEFLRSLKDAGLGQALVLSTCDRVEIHAIHADPQWTADILRRALAGQAGLEPGELAETVYTLLGNAAVRHLFAVASSLDSLVIGEPDILGQVKASHRAARAAGMVASELEGLLQAAYAAAKRVRSETAIGRRPVSIAAAAVEVAREIHGDLARRSGLLVGLGEMGELIVHHLRSAGLARLVVTHRANVRAQHVAHRLAANVHPFEALEDALATADIVVACAGLGRYIITRKLMAAALRRRRRRPVFVIDLAVAGDAEPAVGELDGAFLYDLNDLERVAEAGRAERETAAAAAWRLIDDELASFGRGQAMQAAVPAVVALRSHFEAVRERVLAEVKDGGAAEATRLLVNRLLHDPSAALREMAADDESDEDVAHAEGVLRRLFRLRSGRSGGEEDSR